MSDFDKKPFLSSFFDSRDNSFWEWSHVVTQLIEKHQSSSKSKTQVVDIVEGGGCPKNMFNKTTNRTLLWEQQEVGVVFKALQVIQRKFDASQVEHKVVVKKVFISEKAWEEVMERHKVCLWQ